MEIIERNATAQAQLIEDLLDVSRIVAGKLQLAMRPLENVAPLVNGVVESFRPTAQARHITLTASSTSGRGRSRGIATGCNRSSGTSCPMPSSSRRQAGAWTSGASATNGEVEIGVTDTGKGIPAAFLPHIFDRFRQADSTSTRAHGGLGLGLSIVRHLVELHGGTVSAASAGEGKGATITVRLPGRPMSQPGSRRAAERRHRAVAVATGAHVAP